jgi:hypothetical protein
LLSIVRKFLSLLCAFFLTSIAVADVDIRVANTNALLDSTQIDYVATISSCGALTSIQAGSSGDLTRYDSSDVVLDPNSPEQCLLNFSLAGSERFNPTVVITHPDASDEIFTES